MTAPLFSILIDSLNNPIDEIEEGQGYTLLERFEDKIIYTIATATANDFDSWVDPSDIETYVYQYQKNRNGDYYLTIRYGCPKRHKENMVLIEPLKGGKHTSITEKLKGHLIDLYDEMTGEKFNEIENLYLPYPTVYDISFFLHYPLFRYSLPRINFDRRNACGAGYGATDSSEVVTVIRTSAAFGSNILTALQESNSLDTFCDLMFSKSSLKTEEDYQRGSEVSVSWLMASWGWDLTLTEQFTYEKYFMSSSVSSSSAAMKFICDWGTKEEKQLLLDSFVKNTKQPAAKYSLRSSTPIKSNIETIEYTTFQVAQLSKYGMTRKESLLAASYMVGYLTEVGAEDFDEEKMNFEVALWYAKNVRPRTLSSTKYTKEDVYSIWHQLFGETISEADELMLFAENDSLGVVNTHFLKTYKGTRLWKYLDDICDLPSLAKDVFTGVFYEPTEEQLTHLNGFPVSYDNFILGLKTAAIKIDEKLNSLDLPTTSKNRCIYLQLKPSDRCTKNSWLFYEWDIEANKISAFNFLAKTLPFETLEEFSRLPNDLFYRIVFDCEPPKTQFHS